MTVPENYPSSLISPLLSAGDLILDEPLSLGIMASGSGSNFENIVEAIESGRLNARVPVMLFNKATARVKERAERHRVRSVFLDHRKFPDREEFDRAIVRILRDHGAEWAIMAGWMRIVTPVLLDAFPDRVINIHPSLLPSFRGVRAVEQALAAGAKISGCTVHIARAEVDSGPILAQAAVPVYADDTPESLHERIQVQEHRIFPMAITLAAKRSGSRVPSVRELAGDR